jgi:DegV family protein with EDD domain
MQKVAILTDSIACLPPEIIEKYRLRVLPVNIQFEGRIYRDGVDLDTAEAYRMLENDPDLFSSSPASAGEYARAYLEAAKEADSLLCITLSTNLSTACNMARLGCEEVQNELRGIPIEVFDSRSAAIGEGLIVTAAARAASAGKNLDEVVKLAGEVRDKTKVIGIMETIKYVYRTGRIPRVTARIGSMLNIKPVFTVEQGTIRVAGLSWNKESGVNRALAMMKKDTGGRPVCAAVAHADASEEAKVFLERIRSEFTCVESWITDFSPVMAYATGTGVLAVAYHTGAEGADEEMG